MVKKSCLLLFLLLLFPLVSASLKIEKTAVTDTIIPELNNSAVFNFKFTNLGDTDSFKLYSVVGARFDPSDYFTIESGEIKEIPIKVYLTPNLLEETKVYNFQYKIEVKVSGVQDDEMAIKVFKFKDVFEINSYNLNLEAENALIYIKNLGDYPFSEITADFHSDFFDIMKKFSLDAYEKKEFSVPLNQDVKKLVAGDYVITADVQTLTLANKFENTFKFLEKVDIKTTQTNSGIIIRKFVVDKTNQGNLPTVVQVKVKKNIISRLFTTFNTEPSAVDRKGFTINYLFQKEIKPSETFTVGVITNWFYPLIIIIILIVIGYLVKKYTASDLIIRKHANFVKTKGGEFALKVSLVIKAKKHAEKIRITDRLPHVVKLFEKFSAIAPTRIDEKNKRIEWDLESLQENEERVLSYIIYSKVGVVGKFELPSATAVFEVNGKMKNTSSSRVFFLTDTTRGE